MNLSKYHVDGYGTRNSQLNQLMYQHMANHYNKILSAKPVVDTSKPKSFKPHSKQMRNANLVSCDLIRPFSSHSDFLINHQLSISEHKLLDEILASAQYSPALISHSQWDTDRKEISGGGRLQNFYNKNSRESQQQSWLTKSRIVKKQTSEDLVERHKDQFQALGTTFWPRILKTDAESKLRGMRVYHPPKRKQLFDKEEWGSNASEREVCEEIVHDPKEASQASSRDSAYNGGTSSAAESRSPTPYRNKKRGLKHSATQTEGGAVTKGPSRRRSQSHQRDDNGDNSGTEYLKFIHDITCEVVEKGHYSDKALGRVIDRHVSANAQSLDHGRMMDEVQKLRKRLGVISVETDYNKFDESIYENSRIQSQEYSLSDSDTWTKHYSNKVLETNYGTSFQKEGETAVFTPSVSVSISEEIVETNKNSFDRRLSKGDDEEDEKDTDSSFESTVKENLQTEVQQSEVLSDEITSSSSCSDTGQSE